MANIYMWTFPYLRSIESYRRAAIVLSFEPTGNFIFGQEDRK